MGGVFNHINSNLYHYAGNNPVRYVDPDGRIDSNTFYQFAREWYNQAPNIALADSPAEDESIQKTGTFLNPEFIESKYFSLTKEGAMYEGEVLSKLDKKDEKYSIYKTAIPKSQITPDMMITVDLGVPAVVVPTEKLPLLLPPEKIE